jgi:hypothetical protein
MLHPLGSGWQPAWWVDNRDPARPGARAAPRREKDQGADRRRHERDRTFKVYQPSRLHQLLRSLGDATPDSWLEIRSFRGNVTRVTTTDLAATTTEDLNSFILGTRPAS